MTTPATSGNPLFFRLDIDSLAILSRLRYSEFRVYAYLRASDWFCNKQQALDMPHLLSVCAISKTSAYLALANLHAKGYIEWLHIKSDVRVKPLISDDDISHPRESIPTSGTGFPPVGLDSHPRENRHLKVAVSGDSDSSRSLDRSDLLEETKRDVDISTDEEYQQWVAIGIDSLPSPPQGHFRERQIEKGIEDPKNQALYKKKKNRKKASTKALEPVPSFPTNGEFQQQQQEQRLGTLQHLWASGQTSRVKAAIGANPDWKIAIGEFGPCLAGDVE